DRPGDYQSVIRLTVVTDRRTRDIAGTLFGGDKPRIVEIKGIRVEAELGRHMLYTTNEDKPGYIGRLGTLLGEAGVNIATFHLGRSAPGADAIALIEVDQALDDALLARVRAIPGVMQAEALAF
ncbi:MAG: ACT domain-containing protein, partial [Dongiaceae bacterium]